MLVVHSKTSGGRELCFLKEHPRMLSLLGLGWVFSSLQPRLIKADGILSHLFPPGGCRLLEFPWDSSSEDQRMVSIPSLPTLDPPSSLVRVSLLGIRRSASQASVSRAEAVTA